MSEELTKAIVAKAMDKLQAYGPFIEGYSIVQEACDGKVVWVGGAVYRNILNTIHRYGHTPVDYDSDLLVFGDVNRIKLPDNCYWEGKAHSDDKSKTGLRLRILKHSIDIIDGRQWGNIDGYFAHVPLDIQAIAYDPDAEALMGHGINAIESLTLDINCDAWAAKDEIYTLEYCRGKCDSIPIMSLGPKYKELYKKHNPSSVSIFSNQWNVIQSQHDDFQTWYAFNDGTF